jgi:hypothetical protein
MKLSNVSATVRLANHFVQSRMPNPFSLFKRAFPEFQRICTESISRSKRRLRPQVGRCEVDLALRASARGTPPGQVTQGAVKAAFPVVTNDPLMSDFAYLAWHELIQ